MLQAARVVTVANKECEKWHWARGIHVNVHRYLLIGHFCKYSYLIGQSVSTYTSDWLTLYKYLLMIGHY